MFYFNRPPLVDGLIKTHSESQTKLEKLSDSVMKKTALNETYSASDSSSDGSTSSGMFTNFSIHENTVYCSIYIQTYILDYVY